MKGGRLPLGTIPSYYFNCYKAEIALGGRNSREGTSEGGMIFMELANHSQIESKDQV